MALCAQSLSGEPHAEDVTSQEAEVLDEEDSGVSWCHLQPEEQPNSHSPSRGDTLAELCLPGNTHRMTLGTTTVPGGCPWYSGGLWGGGH
jgi:hypothetical protein